MNPAQTGKLDFHSGESTLKHVSDVCMKAFKVKATIQPFAYQIGVTRGEKIGVPQPNKAINGSVSRHASAVACLSRLQEKLPWAPLSPLCHCVFIVVSLIHIASLIYEP